MSRWRIVLLLIGWVRLLRHWLRTETRLLLLLLLLLLHRNLRLSLTPCICLLSRWCCRCCWWCSRYWCYLMRRPRSGLRPSRIRLVLLLAIPQTRLCGGCSIRLGIGRRPVGLGRAGDRLRFVVLGTGAVAIVGVRVAHRGRAGGRRLGRRGWGRVCLLGDPLRLCLCVSVQPEEKWWATCLVVGGPGSGMCCSLFGGLAVRILVLLLGGGLSRGEGGRGALCSVGILLPGVLVHFGCEMEKQESVV